jgi:glycosyltransferase involved in cell wall biosynthesis
MNLLFVHDIKTLIYKGEAYARSYGPDIWKRYLRVFDGVTVCTRCKSTIEDQIKGIDKVTGDKVNLDSRIGEFLGPDAFFSRRIRAVIQENIRKHDGVVVRLDSFLGLIAVRECKRMKKPFLVECVGCAWDSFWNHGISGKILAPFLYAQMKLAIRHAPYVVYVTKEFLQHRYPTYGENTNISNVALKPIDIDVRNKRLEHIETYSETGSCKHLMTIANVGVRYKGFQFVIKALGLIKKQTGECHYIYHIVGEGDQTYLREQAAKAGVGENVIFHGPVSHEKIFELLQNEVDIYVQPSLQEGLPRAMIEAMSCALPCIGTDVAGIPELIQKEFIYKRSGKMPEQIVRILESYTKEQMKSAAGYNFENSKNYSSDILTQRRTDFLKKYKDSLAK